MDLLNLSTADLIGTLLGFAFTLMVFSYILGDNPIFRLAIHIFIGVAAGYAAVVALYSVIWPQLILPLLGGTPTERLFLLIPLVLSGLLLTKISPRLAVWGNPVLAYLVGVGVATAIGGAVLGTIFPQVLASINLFDPAAGQQTGTDFWAQITNGGVVLVGTLTTLAYFHFGVRARPGQVSLTQPAQRGAILEGIAGVGQVFIGIAFGTLFAGVYVSALTALIERLRFLVDFILPLVLPR